MLLTSFCDDLLLITLTVGLMSFCIIALSPSYILTGMFLKQLDTWANSRLFPPSAIDEEAGTSIRRRLTAQNWSNLSEVKKVKALRLHVVHSFGGGSATWYLGRTHKIISSYHFVALAIIDCGLSFALLK